MKGTDYPDQQFQPSLQTFIAQRAELMAALRALSPAGWSRTAILTGAGKPLEQTVLSYGQRMARHERPHVKQIERLVRSLRPGRAGARPRIG